MALSKDNFFSVFLTVRNPSPKKVSPLPGAITTPAVVLPSVIDTTIASPPPVTPLLFSPQRKPLHPPDNYNAHARFSDPFDMSDPEPALVCPPTQLPPLRMRAMETYMELQRQQDINTAFYADMGYHQAPKHIEIPGQGTI